MTRRTVAVVFAALSLTTAGCATRGALSTAEARIDALEQRVATLGANAQGSDDRLASAERAAAEARQSALRADESARTAEAIFKRQVAK